MPDLDASFHELQTSKQPLGKDEWLFCWRLVADTIRRAALEPEDPRLSRIQQLLNALDYHYVRGKAEAFYQTFVHLHDLLTRPQ